MRIAPIVTATMRRVTTKRQILSQYLVILSFLLANANLSSAQPAISITDSKGNQLIKANSQQQIPTQAPPSTSNQRIDSIQTSSKNLLPSDTSTATTTQTSAKSATEYTSNLNSPPPDSWFDTLLGHLDRQILSNEPVIPIDTYSDSEEDNDTRVDVQSHAPTDSEEDLLEGITISSIGSIDSETSEKPEEEQQVASTQYSLTESSQTDDKLQVSDEDDRIVETNSVKELLADSSSRRDISPIVTPPSRVKVTCQEAYTKCGLRKFCAPTLRTYIMECKEFLKNQTQEISAKCLEAMTAIWSLEDSNDLMNCDCQDNEHCIYIRKKTTAFKSRVDAALDPKSIVTCSMATRICQADESCSPALDFYYMNCQTLFSQRYCSSNCNNSLAILYGQPKASKLINCRCDGTEDFPCLKYKTLTERFCLNKHSRSLFSFTDSSSSSSSPYADSKDNSAGASDGRQVSSPLAASSEDADGGDDLANEAHDNQRSPFGISSSSQNESHKDYEESQIHSSANNEDSDWSILSGSNSNGVQSTEDNYIPFFNVRYFSNLQLRQENKSNSNIQYQNDNHQQLPQAPRPSQQPRRKQHQQAQRNSRKPYRSVKQRSNHRMQQQQPARPSLLFALASTSNSASSLSPLFGGANSLNGIENVNRLLTNMTQLILCNWTSLAVAFVVAIIPSQRWV